MIEMALNHLANKNSSDVNDEVSLPILIGFDPLLSLLVKNL